VPNQRFKKFERSQIPPRFRIGAIDLQILNDLAAYRFLDTKQILNLHPDYTARTVRSRLQLLFHSGYVERPIGQVSYYEHPHLIYSLAKKGAALVSQNKELPLPVNKPKEMGISFMRHSLMISDFKLALTAALKNNSQFKLAAWKELGAIDAVNCEGERLPIAPDAFFTIESKDYLAHFFLEADRSTMTRERMLNKFKGYWNWRLEEGQKRKLGIANFRVLTVCLSEERVESLRQIAKKAGGGQTGSDMFWFGCAKSYGLESPENILTPIWRSAKGESLRHLLE
jgi:hypothetical protein